MLKRLLLAATALLIAGSSSAQLVDRGAYLFDPVQSLDWLKLPETKNNTYAQVSARISQNGDLFGWTFATRSQVRQVFDTLAGPPGAFEGGVVRCDESACLLHTDIYRSSTRSWTQPVFSTFGESFLWPSNWTVNGSPFVNRAIFGMVVQQGLIANITNNFGGFDAGVINEGITIEESPEVVGQSAFLVRAAVPEPGSAMLLGLGVIGLLSRAIRHRSLMGHQSQG